MATNVIDVENTEVSAVQSRSVELAAPIVEPCIVSADDYTVSVEKQEYSRCYLYWIHLPEHTDIRNEGYVGITNNLSKRWSRHRMCTDTSYHLQNSIKKHGDDLVYDVVFLSSRDYCSDMEKTLRPRTDIGWNIRSGGDNTFTMPKQTEEVKQKRGIYRTGKDNPSFGRKHTQAMKDKISKIHKGKVLTEEQKSRISKGSKGRILAEEHKKHMSEVRKGVKLTAEHKEKISKAQARRKVVNLDTGEVFNSILEASATIDGRSSISAVCRNRQKTTGGYRWAYYEDVHNE